MFLFGARIKKKKKTYAARQLKYYTKKSCFIRRISFIIFLNISCEFNLFKNIIIILCKKKKQKNSKSCDDLWSSSGDAGI